MKNGNDDLPTRVQFLLKGVEITGAKNKTFGEPLFNLSLAGSVKRMLRQNQQRQMSAGEEEALEQVITLICRAYSGDGFTEKTYVNGATYFAIAGEIAHFHSNQSQVQAESSEAARIAADAETKAREAALAETLNEAMDSPPPLTASRN